MKFFVAVSFSLISSAALAQGGPMPVNQMTPSLLTQLEYQYPKAAVDCLTDSLAKVAASGRDYLFTSDLERGQLWLISLDGLNDETVMQYICTPQGLADTPQAAAEAMFGGGMVFPQ